MDVASLILDLSPFKKLKETELNDNGHLPGSSRAWHSWPKPLIPAAAVAAHSFALGFKSTYLLLSIPSLLRPQPFPLFLYSTRLLLYR